MKQISENLTLDLRLASASLLPLGLLIGIFSALFL